MKGDSGVLPIANCGHRSDGREHDRETNRHFSLPSSGERCVLCGRLGLRSLERVLASATHNVETPLCSGLMGRCWEAGMGVLGDRRLETTSRARQMGGRPLLCHLCAKLGSRA